MADDNADYGDSLAEAQELGYAEPDPTADVSGADAAAKAAILASLAFGTWVGLDDVYHEGIDSLSPVDMAFASDFGYAVKLVGIAERIGDGISARVHPVMIPLDHPLASIRGATNAIFIEGPSVGELLFSGPGAGGAPTATAVLGDIIDAAGFKIQALDTPGHAYHHMAYLVDGLCFTGDVAAVRLPGYDHVRLPTPPPDTTRVTP